MEILKIIEKGQNLNEKQGFSKLKVSCVLVQPILGLTGVQDGLLQLKSKNKFLFQACWGYLGEEHAKISRRDYSVKLTLI